MAANPLAISLFRTYEVEISHSDNYIHYINAHFRFSEPLLADAEEAEAYLKARAEAQAEQISLYCTPELYTELVGEPGAFPGDLSSLDGGYAMIARAGIRDYELSLNRPSGAVRLQLLGCSAAVRRWRSCGPSAPRPFRSCRTRSGNA